ncbi:molybdopterin-dependent oxidoreductase [Aeromicrobium sp. CF3.5]|uniref:molybdopterin-dependent oxidoreductase n=1 Tax=Aeromicrobium sp. CF3.5 TaxID=3373078 RepID=UPI003EE81677
MNSRGPVLSGVLGAGAGLALSEALAAVFDLRESPLLAVGQGVINLTPGPVAETIIGWVGTADKPLAVTAVVLAVLALGALAGHWWQPHRLRAFSLVVLLVAGAITALFARPYGSVEGVFVCTAAGVAMLGVLKLLERGAGEAAPGAVGVADRRSFIRTVGLVAIGIAVLGGGSQLLAARRRRRRDIEAARAALTLPRRPVTVPDGANLDVPGVASWNTSNRDFYRIDTALSPPLIDPIEWSLRIHGMVDNEITLSYQDLIDRGLSDAWITLTCVSNPVGGDLIGNTVWGGVPIKDILDEAGVQGGADALLSTSDDGWTCGTPLAALTDGRDALLAITMNGEPLPIVHGFPVRQVVPGLYGYVSATKWVVDWEVTRFSDFEAYWTQRGWGERGEIKTGSRIDVPRASDELTAGPTRVGGVAWHQNLGISGVEVDFGDGRWRAAEISSVPTDDTWVQWVIDWDAPEGRHEIAVRAIDADGVVQTPDLADVLPDGATGHHVISVSVT